MSSTQRSRAIAALAALVTLLAVAAVLSSVLSGNNGDTAATATSVGTPPPAAANLQVDAANVRSQGGGASAAGPSAQAGGSQATQVTVSTVTTAVAAGQKEGSTTVVKPPVAAAPGSGATSPTVTVTTAATARPGPTKPVASQVTASSTPASVVTSMTVVTAPTSTATTAKPTTATTAKATTTTAATSSTQPPPASGGLNAVELEIARMTNELRTNPNGPLARKKPAPSCVQVDGGGKVVAVPALTLSEPVSVNMSRPWSVDMNGRNTMDHRSSASAVAIYTQLGISPSTYGENVAWFQGYSDAQGAQVLFEGWRESDGHYCNMMSAGYTSFGVGVYKGSSRTWGTQNFYATR